MNIFIFHRDFRLHDNVGLVNLVKQEKVIHLIFIFTKEQVKNNPYFSQKSFAAMIHCLKSLNQQTTINFLAAENESTAIKHLIKEGHKIKNIYTNYDYTNYSRQRSEKLYHLAKKHNFIYREFNDYSLIEPFLIKTVNHGYYSVFSPFWNKLKSIFTNEKIPIYQEPSFQAQSLTSKIKIDISKLKANDFGLPLTFNDVKQAIFNLDENYDTTRDLVSLDHGTSKISTSLKFGVISIRQAYLWGTQKFLNFDNAFNRQLAFRDFYYQVVYNGQLYSKWEFGTNWNHKLKIKWDNNQEWFEQWKKGETGFDFVDAGMKELNETGRLHNRARMVCASFLVKNLQIDWKLGEQYFANKLIDYDPIINQCSWQWVAGTGFDAQPYFRIFNPELQQKKFDPQKIYINKYLKNRKGIDKIVDYKTSVKKALAIYHLDK